MRLDEVTVIVRSAHERTTSLCAALARAEVDQVETIYERPFRSALIRGFELGIERALPWTLCLDADILLLCGGIVRMLEAVRAEPQALGCGGWMHDKYYGDFKVRGAHLYRTSLLQRALELARQTMPTQPRPETWVHEQMENRGAPWLLSAGAVGLHGHGQYYRDIFRTNAVRANKSASDHERLVRRARLGALYDRDFLVMLWGLQFGAKSAGPVSLDRDHWGSAFDDLRARYGIDEKSAPSRAEAAALRAALIALGRVPSRMLWWGGKRLARVQQRLYNGWPLVSSRPDLHRDAGRAQLKPDDRSS